MTTDVQSYCAGLAHSIEQLEAKIQREVAGLSAHEDFLTTIHRLVQDPEELTKELQNLRDADSLGAALASLLAIPIALVRLEQEASTCGQSERDR